MAPIDVARTVEVKLVGNPGVGNICFPTIENESRAVED